MRSNAFDFKREFRDARVRIVEISLCYVSVSTIACQPTRPVTLITFRDVWAFMNCEDLYFLFFSFLFLIVIKVFCIFNITRTY